MQYIKKKQEEIKRCANQAMTKIMFHRPTQSGGSEPSIEMQYLIQRTSKHGYLISKPRRD